MADRTVLLMATLLVASLVAVPGAAGAVPAGDQTTDAGQAATVGVTERDAQTTEANETDWCEPVAGGEQREHPDKDTLGFENGCWYDDPLNIDRSDGLNETELDAVVGRSMARVEEVRELEFEHNVPVKIISREEFANQTSSRNYSESFRLHQNVKYEALFMVGEDTSAIKEEQENTAGNVQGYYSPSNDQIVIISETDTPKMDEITLAQELFHGLQQQKFDMNYDWSTQERHNANDGIIEGDGNYVDYLYEQRCNEGWNCLMPEGGGAGVAPPGFHWGLYSLTIQPYSEGPEFVAEIHQEQGWEGVNKLYDNPPQSTEQTIHPDKYGEDEPRDMTFTDKSNDEWNVLDVKGGINYAEFGETGLFAMLWYPAQRAGSDVTVIGSDYFFNAAGSNGGGFHNYDHSMSAGWDGDRLYPYVNDSSFENNETGYVWKIAFDSEDEAAEFLRGYDSLLWGYGFEVDDRQNTYVVRDGAFEDAYYYEQQGDTVFIVNAPSVEDLDKIREGASPEATPTPTPSPTPTPEDTATPTPTAAETPAETPTETQAPTATPTPTPMPTEELTTAAESGANADDGDAETTAGSGPGFGALLALTALAVTLATAALARRR